MATTKTCILLLTIHLASVVTAQEVVRRVPQGFLGMRGKKYYELNENEYYKRKPQFFIGVKGKKDDLSSEIDSKRAPMGFMGVRGKKESYPDVMIYPESLEYVPNNSGSLFGQIDYSTDENGNTKEYPILNEVINDLMDKMHADDATKEYSDENTITNEIEKRANMHRFYAVRGKKSMQGKKPYDVSFRGKFVGVRGKKDLKNSGAQEIRFLVNSPFAKRRMQTGFLGVRGKKSAEDNDLESGPAISEDPTN